MRKLRGHGEIEEKFILFFEYKKKYCKQSPNTLANYQQDGELQAPRTLVSQQVLHVQTTVYFMIQEKG